MPLAQVTIRASPRTTEDSLRPVTQDSQMSGNSVNPERSKRAEVGTEV